MLNTNQNRKEMISLPEELIFFQGRILFYWIKIKFNADNMIWSKNKFKMKRLMREKM